MTRENQRLNHFTLAGVLFFSVFFSLSLFLSEEVLIGMVFAGCSLSIVYCFFSDGQSVQHKPKRLTASCVILWSGITLAFFSKPYEDVWLLFYFFYPLSLATIILLGLKKGLIILLLSLSVNILLQLESDIDHFHYFLLSYAVYLPLLGFLMSHIGKLEHDLQRAVTTDPLTGCSSIDHFKKQVRASGELQRRYKSDLTCMVFSTNKPFKTPRHNETFLKEVAQICQSRIRQTDVICHYTANYFLILLPNTSDSSAENLGKDLVQACGAFSFSGLNKDELSPAAFYYTLKSYTDDSEWDVWFDQLTQGLSEKAQ